MENAKSTVLKTTNSFTRRYVKWKKQPSTENTKRQKVQPLIGSLGTVS